MISICFDFRRVHRTWMHTLTSAALALSMAGNVARAQRSPPLGFERPPANSARVLRLGDGYRVSTKETGTTLKNDVPHGVIGGALGAVAGGLFGYYLAIGLCEKSGGCSGGSAALAGAAIGAILGVGVEWLVRRH